MSSGMSRAQERLSDAIATMTIHRRMRTPDDGADHLLAPDDEAVLGRWNTAGRTVKDSTPESLPRTEPAPRGTVLSEAP